MDLSPAGYSIENINDTVTKVTCPTFSDIIDRMLESYNKSLLGYLNRKAWKSLFRST